MSKASFFDLGPERLNRLLSIGKEESDDADDSTVESSACTAEGSSLIEKPGSWIGRYKLLRALGEGGMGIVYLAEQVEPIKRQVALKVIKPGMDSAQVIRRFEAERQALALLDYPNVAHVYDAGTTEAGRPYFVMEYVKGVPITEHCDRQRLTIEERLKLFVKVCEAIQHAHQQGIIHRDIKPSNIQVCIQGQEAVPKVIDFGVAKALSQPFTERTFVTEQGQLIGTPEYLSPEQAEMTNQDIDTRSDIYSLGVVLYELLSGVLPFDAKTLREGGVDHIRQVIRGQEPKTPSTRLSTLSAEDSTRIANHHRVDLSSLRRKLRGDLDWITLKAMEKDRTRRYNTAEALAEDIKRHLNHEPVSARSPTVRYRAGKYVRRHRRVLAMAIAFAVVLILGTTLSVWQAHRAGQAEKERASLRDAQWALGTAMPEIERLLEKDDYAAAFKLLEQTRPSIGDDPRFQALWARVVGVISVETEPPGAEVFLRDYSELNPDWEPIGKSPLSEMKMPRGFKRWKVTLPGYEVAEGAVAALTSNLVKLKVKLDKIGTIPPGMVRIQGTQFKASLLPLDSQTLPLLDVSDFLLDRYEVTNRQFKEFVAAGGYEKREYWKHKFVRDGKEMSWEDAIRGFVDQTGQLGPATWEHGDFPKDQEDYPVGGVSWYEAAAYAEWAGKRLPTVYHWSLAAGDILRVDVAFVIPLSNFGGKGPAPVRTFQGMTSHGIYDMAGNVKEWCFNEVPEGDRVIAGGGWNEPEYMFSYGDKYPPFFREGNFGFRCMKLLMGEAVWEQAGSPVQYRPKPRLGDQRPCPDLVFDAYRRLYNYDESELQPTIEATEDLGMYTRLEKVSFNTAYGNERMIAYLYLPRTGQPPFQTVVYWPGRFALSLHSIAGYISTDTFERHTKGGRAFVFPVLQGTFERIAPSEKQGKTTAPGDSIGDKMAHVPANGIMWVKDIRRTIDYLETRPKEFDINKLAYEGLSWGGIWGGVVPAIESRIKVAVILGGGLDLALPPECSQVNFAPHIKIPILLQGGRYDVIFPVESNQKPFLGLFGTTQEDRQHKIYETGHSCWLKNEVAKDELDFLDKYLGPAK